VENIHKRNGPCTCGDGYGVFCTTSTAWLLCSFSSLCRFEMKGVLCNWQIAGKSAARWGGRGRSGSWLLKITKTPPIPFRETMDESPAFFAPSTVFLSLGERFDSGLLSQIKRDRYSMIQYSVSWKDLNAGCCITPTISLSNSGDASEVSRTISGSRLQAADWAATRLSHSCSMHASPSLPPAATAALGA
jgi:hypothetical protein